MAKRSFLSPIINPLVVGAIRLLMPTLRRTLFGGISISIAADDLAKLRQYKGQRMLLLPNHPTGEEPVVLFDIATALDEVFNFVAAREVFDWEHGFRGWLLRRVGVYSVIRGAADRDSFLMSKKILMAGKNRLVIFIEGEISRENETLIPFEPGVVQLACWAQEGLIKEAAKQKKSQSSACNNSERQENSVSSTQPSEAPPIYLAPIAIKYFYQPNCAGAIEDSLIALEKAAGLPLDTGMNRYQRVRSIGEQILHVQEELHQIIALPGTSLADRVLAIKNRMLRKIELFLDLKPDPSESTLDRLRAIRNTMDHLIHIYDDPTEQTEYEQRTIDHLRKTLSEFYLDLDRVVYFLTYNQGYLTEDASNERLIEMIRRLEREIYGEAKLLLPRVAVLKVGEVMDLKQAYPAYEADKKAFIKKTAAMLEDNTMALLSAIKRPSLL
jgi:1-acyl-sn-glycerol-3-phosphate acyltransferase